MTIERLDSKPETATHSSPLPLPPRRLNWRVLGPSAVLAATAIGSGELIFWPGLSMRYSAGVLLIALGCVALQYFVDIEIGRYSLATGESIVVGATRLWRGWGIVLLLGTIVPWLWPGWARAGSQMLGWAFGLPEKPLSIFSLLICGLLLALPSRVYKFVELLQSVLLAFILVGVFVLFLMVMKNTPTTMPFWKSLLQAKGLDSLLAQIGSARSGNFFSLLGGVVFAGAGGILNLGYGLMLCEKRFGMGAYSKAIVGLRHSEGLEQQDTNLEPLTSNQETAERWKRWLRLARQEHSLLFFLSNSFTIIFIALIFFCLLGQQSSQQGMSFLQTATTKLAENNGHFASLLFVAVGYAIFFTSELGIIDITSRLAAGIVHTSFNPSKQSPSRIYHGFVWGEIIIGIILIGIDPRQPFWFLVTTGILNTLVMAIYIWLVMVINRKLLPSVASPSKSVDIFLSMAGLIYMAFFILALMRMS